MSIRILLADDHELFREGLRSLLAQQAGLEVVAEAQDGHEAVRAALESEPEVVIMDVTMPGLNGIEATRQILAHQPHIGILVITMFEDESVFAAIRAGARGYILKGAEGEETLRAIRAVANGESIFSPAIAQRLTKFFAAAPDPTARPFPDLTDREREILTLLAQGLTNGAIAERLYLSPKTVRNQVSTIFSKLQVADRAAAIIKAREAGLGQQ